MAWYVVTAIENDKEEETLSTHDAVTQLSTHNVVTQLSAP